MRCCSMCGEQVGEHLVGILDITPIIGIVTLHVASSCSPSHAEELESRFTPVRDRSRGVRLRADRPSMYAFFARSLYG
jgi:hypothetical protein